MKKELELVRGHFNLIKLIFLLVSSKFIKQGDNVRPIIVLFLEYLIILNYRLVLIV